MATESSRNEKLQRILAFHNLVRFRRTMNVPPAVAVGLSNISCAVRSPQLQGRDEVTPPRAATLRLNSLLPVLRAFLVTGG